MTSDVSIKICRFDGRKCDISGKYIERGEPFLSIFNIKIKNRNIKKKISKLRENTIKCERINAHRNVNGKCAMCDEHGKTLKLKAKSGNRFNGFLLCDNCLDKISENTVKKSQEIDKSVHYWDSSGVCIFDREISKEDFLFDYISCNGIKENAVIMIVSHDNPFYCSIYNIENLKKTLKQRDTCGKRFSCDICQEQKSDVQMIYSAFMICDNCRNDILTTLEEYMEKNKEFIISRTI